MSNFKIIIVPAGVLAPSGAWPSAGKVRTMFGAFPKTGPVLAALMNMHYFNVMSDRDEIQYEYIIFLKNLQHI